MNKIRHLGKAARILSKDQRVPRWLRIAFGVCLLPIPGPFDNVGAVLVGAVIFLRYPDAVREAWSEAKAA